jgi:phenylpropionate dioxygenase-like ring-hydroxylating dioxygenase large terminal subunit
VLEEATAKEEAMTTTESRPEVPTGPRAQSVPNEGDNDLFSEQWYPVCLSSDVDANGIHGVDFLDGRVIVMRDKGGVATVLSAYCAHLGVDLSLAERDGDKIKCPFHLWEYDIAGSCVGTGVGERPPRTARLYRFPTQEMYGIVFAFNGEHATYELPRFSVSDDELVYRAAVIPDLLSVDPWVVAANTPDLSHTVLLHGLDYQEDPYERVKWTDHSLQYPVHARLPEGQMFDVSVAIHGTNYYFQEGPVDGRWFGWATPLGVPSPGQTQVFYIIAAKKQPGESAEQTDAFLDYVLGIEMHLVSQDMPVFQGIRYRPRDLTRSDRVLARFFEYVRRYPRAHPAAQYIR